MSARRYSVQSGTLRAVVTAWSPGAALRVAIRQRRPRMLGVLAKIQPRGRPWRPAVYLDTRPAARRTK